MNPLQNLCATGPKAEARRALRASGIAVAALLALAAFAPSASADLPGVAGDNAQAAAPVVNKVAQPVDDAAGQATEPAQQAAAPAVDQAAQAAAPAVDQATQDAAPVVDQATQHAAPVVDQATQAAAPVVRDVARATSQVSRPAADQVSQLADSVISAGQDTSRSAGQLTRHRSSGDATGAPRHASSTPATHTPNQATAAPTKLRLWHHSFSLAHPASPHLAQAQAGGLKPALAANRPFPSTGSGTEPSRQPGGRPSPAPAPLHGPATQEGAVASGSSGGAAGASGAILITFMLAASLGLRRLSLASDPLGPAPLVLLPERPG